jgi:hypothetical protein
VDTATDLVPDRYPFEIIITAIIEETLQEVTITLDWMQGAVVDFTGYGPQLVVEAFTADAIVPGEHFDLELQITNEGDDTARNCWVALPPDGTAVDFVNFMGTVGLYKMMQEMNNTALQIGPAGWKIPFIGFVPGGTNFSFDKADGWITMEEMDLDSAYEIVQLNLYIEGVYSNPGSTIHFIKIQDLGPGETVNVTFDMIADKDMVNGKPYNINVGISGTDSEGVPINNPNNVPTGAAYNNQGIVQTLEVMSSQRGGHYDPVESDWFDIGVKALGLLLFLIIILAILLLVMNRFKGEEDEWDDEDEFGYDDEDDFAFEAADEPAEAPPEAPGELVEP